MKTFILKKNTGNKPASSGNNVEYTANLQDRQWKVLTIRDAKYNEWNGKKVLDLFFEGCPDNLNMRVFEAHNRDGDEFAISNVFRYANAGLKSGSPVDGNNDTLMVEFDDSPEGLIGKELNVFAYKDGKYFKLYNRFAPAQEFENVVEKITEDYINWCMVKAQENFIDWVLPKLQDAPENNSYPEGNNYVARNNTNVINTNNSSNSTFTPSWGKK